jgi:MFS transporter, FSR family, fosmidomycin resistance protein
MDKKLSSLNMLHIVNDGFLASLLLLVPFFAKDFSIPLSKVGLLGTGLNIVIVGIAIPSGYVAKKVGAFKPLLYGILVYSLGYILVGTTTSFWILLAVFVMTGIGFGIFHPLSFALIARWSEQATRGKKIGNFTAIGDIGRIGLTTGITFLIGFIGWRNTSILYGLLGIIAFFAAYHLTKGSPTADRSHRDKHHKISTYKQLLTNRNFIASTLAATLDNFASSALAIFLPFLLLFKGVPAIWLGPLTATYFIGNLFGKIVLGRAGDTYEHRTVFMIAEVVMAFLIFALSVVSQIPLIIMISIALGIVTKGTIPVSQTMISESITDSHHEKAYGVSSTLVGIGTTAAPFVLGLIADRYGIVTTFQAAAALALSTFLPLLAHKKYE